jgi:uncharacterized membrane protein YfcA
VIENEILFIALVTFFFAGIIKGVVGLGLPTFSLAVLTVFADLPTAMAILVAPSLVLNFWQAVSGDSFKIILVKCWPFMICATVTVLVGAALFLSLEVNQLSAFLGCLIVLYAITGLFGFQIPVSKTRSKWLGAVFGILNGLFTGLTGSFVVPGVMYLKSLGLNRDQFVQSMGILFTLSTLALLIGLQQNNLFTKEFGEISFYAIVPAIIGMSLGKRVREYFSEKVFNQIFFCVLFVLGAYIVASSRLLNF